MQKNEERERERGEEIPDEEMLRQTRSIGRIDWEMGAI
jgi:hypothetical protein